MIGPLFLYSTSPAPHEAVILDWARRRRSDPARPISAVVVQTPMPEPDDACLEGLRSHFCTQGVDVDVTDSGLAARPDALRPAVSDRIAAADLVLITGGSPQLLYERTADTPAIDALRAASDSGAVIAGCSAGAAAFGVGMVIGRGETPRPIPLWGWLTRTVVAPHFGQYAIEPWLDAFPDCTVLGIPDGAMAFVLGGNDVQAVGSQPLVLKSRNEVKSIGPSDRALLH
ncbi:MAG TPA: Type 1 glutamine amidotransferase-like domain-containing protein [Mycobacteriales bacterium]|nr:Type 1 glutamine amidotransferase-like domain-containing protein [Mycobacteriales bacterium]